MSDQPETEQPETTEEPGLTAPESSSEGGPEDGPEQGLWSISLARQRRGWALFTFVMGLALLGLCALDYALTALVLGAVLVGVGLLGALLPSPRGG